MVQPGLLGQPAAQPCMHARCLQAKVKADAQLARMEEELRAAEAARLDVRKQALAQHRLRLQDRNKQSELAHIFEQNFVGPAHIGIKVSAGPSVLLARRGGGFYWDLLGCSDGTAQPHMAAASSVPSLVPPRRFLACRFLACLMDPLLCVPRFRAQVARDAGASDAAPAARSVPAFLRRSPSPGAAQAAPPPEPWPTQAAPPPSAEAAAALQGPGAPRSPRQLPAPMTVQCLRGLPLRGPRAGRCAWAGSRQRQMLQRLGPGRTWRCKRRMRRQARSQCRSPRHVQLRRQMRPPVLLQPQVPMPLLAAQPAQQQRPVPVLLLAAAVRRVGARVTRRWRSCWRARWMRSCGCCKESWDCRSATQAQHAATQRL